MPYTASFLQGLCGNLAHETDTYFPWFECAGGLFMRIMMHLHTQTMGNMYQFRAPGSQKTMEMPSLTQVSQNGLEQHFGAILKRTPHNLGTPHTAPRRVHIDVLPDVRAGSDPPSVDEAAEEGRRYRSQCAGGVALCLFFTDMPFGSACWRRKPPKQTG